MKNFMKSKNVKVNLTVEHLLGTNIWEDMVRKNYIEPKEPAEAIEILMRNQSMLKIKSVEETLEEVCKDFPRVSPIFRFNPKHDKKKQIFKLVSEKAEISETFEKFFPTIKLLERYFGD